jgi:hypothetical protein
MKLAERSVPVCQGRLMSPNEVLCARYQRGNAPPQSQRSWYLCGDVSEEFFRRLTNREVVAYSLNTFRVDGDKFFIVFALQIREHQVRLLLPLASERSVRFLAEAARTGVFLSLGRAGTHDTHLLEFIDEEGLLNELCKLSENFARLPFDIEPAVLKMACYSMTQASAVPSRLAAVVISKVCLNVVLND